MTVEQFYTLVEVAQRLSTTKRHIQKLMRFGAEDPLPSVLIGGLRRVPASELEAWLARQPRVARQFRHIAESPEGLS